MQRSSGVSMNGRRMLGEGKVRDRAKGAEDGGKG
jgi:hypothetical protein